MAETRTIHMTHCNYGDDTDMRDKIHTMFWEPTQSKVIAVIKSRLKTRGYQYYIVEDYMVEIGRGVKFLNDREEYYNEKENAIAMVLQTYPDAVVAFDTDFIDLCTLTGDNKYAKLRARPYGTYIRQMARAVHKQAAVLSSIESEEVRAWARNRSEDAQIANSVDEVTDSNRWRYDSALERLAYEERKWINHTVANEHE